MAEWYVNHELERIWKEAPVTYCTYSSAFSQNTINKKFWETLIVRFPLIRHGPHRKRRVQEFFIVSCVFVAAVTFSPSRCLATNEGQTYRHTDWWEGFMKNAVEMGSGAMIYIYTKVHKDWFRHSKVNGGGGFTDIYMYINLFLFFQNKESRLMILIKLISVVFSSHANYTDRATAACRRS
jgi:hypothetical protein